MMKYFLLTAILILPLFAAQLEASEQATLLIAIFALAVIGILALFISSQQIRKLKNEHKKMRQQQEDIEKKQHDLLMKMSNNILSITKEAVGTTSKLVELDDKGIRSKLSKVISTENTLLDVTSDLIEFLNLKSKKVKIKKNNFKLENLLNDILGQTRTNYRDSDIELIFNVDDNIPDTLFSDTLSISKILVNLLDFCILNKSKQIILQVSKRNRFNTEPTLHFILYTDMKVEINNNLFNTTYNEKTKKYEGIALYISKELSILLDGNLIARNAKNLNAEFVLTLPYFAVKKEILHENMLDIKALKIEKVFVADSFYQSALSIQNILKNLKFEVDIKTKEEYLTKLPDFSKYDTIVLDERLITAETISKITSLQETKAINVIVLSNLFSKEKEMKLKASKLNKPLTKESIYYTLLNNQKKFQDKANSKQALKIHRDRFKDTPNILLADFIDFKGTNILIVEDNRINQKLVVSMLKKSMINITIANDGQEAIDILFSHNKFDLVLMDINMPIMDGYLATQRIRENSSLDNTPIVALSALTAADEINKIFHAGMNGYLSKPFSKEKLYTVFNTFMIDKKTISTKRDDAKKIEIVNYNGLNVLKGLEQTNGNIIFYIEILKEFLNFYGESDTIFENLVMDHRFEQAKMLCIDVRGLSGSIGADELQELSSEIVQRIVYKKFDLLPNCAQRYTQAISTLKNSINEFTSTQI